MCVLAVGHSSVACTALALGRACFRRARGRLSDKRGVCVERLISVLFSVLGEDARGGGRGHGWRGRGVRDIRG